MTIAHGDSRLHLKGMGLFVPEGGLLLPLSGGVKHDTKGFLEPELDVTTIRDDEGKFFGSTAVEDGTTNYWQEHKSTPTGCVIEEFNPENNYLRVRITATSGAAHLTNGYVTFPSTIGTLSFKARVLNRDQLILKPYLSGRNSSADAGANHTITRDWTLVTQTQTAYLDNNRWNRACFYIGSAATYTDAVIEFKEFQVEPLDHFTSFVIGSRGMGNLKYDISRLGMRDAGCISCWIYNSDSMVNNRETGGSVNNQYLIKVGSDVYDQYKDVISLWIPNNSPRTFSLRSGQTSSDSWSSKGVRLVSSFGEGSWNHFVFQWDKKRLLSGNHIEMYINGELEVFQTDSTTLPTNMMTYLMLGQWTDDGNLMPSTMYEQLMVHPSKGFSAAEIRNWYQNGPFIDPQDQILTW